jgi:hypothetical protein
VNCAINNSNYNLVPNNITYGFNLIKQLKIKNQSIYKLVLENGNRQGLTFHYANKKSLLKSLKVKIDIYNFTQRDLPESERAYVNRDLYLEKIDTELKKYYFTRIPFVNGGLKINRILAMKY